MPTRTHYVKIVLHDDYILSQVLPDDQVWEDATQEVEALRTHNARLSQALDDLTDNLPKEGDE